MKMAISMDTYARDMLKMVRMAEKTIPPRQLYESLRQQVQDARRCGDLVPYELEEELKRREYLAVAEEDKLQRAAAAEESRLAEEMRMPHNVCTVSAAVELWIVKFGDGWVRKRDVPNIATPDTMNWTRLARRLHDVHRMEDQNDHWRVIT